MENVNSPTVKTLVRRVCHQIILELFLHGYEVDRKTIEYTKYGKRFEFGFAIEVIDLDFFDIMTVIADRHNLFYDCWIVEPHTFAILAFRGGLYE